MMSELRQLSKLQEVDRELADKESALQQVESQLGKSDEVDEARLALATVQQKLTESQKQQQSLDWEVRDLTQKIKQFEAKLFDGKTTNAKELMAIQKEVESLKARQGDLEEKLLTVMEQVEAAQREVTESKQALEALEKGWQGKQDDLARRQAELKAGIAQLREKRLEHSRQVSQATLTLYEGVKASRGQAVARVEKGMCQGCRLILPVGEWQRVRSGALVQCSSCGRILVLE